MQYTITIHDEQRRKFSFRYIGRINIWTRLCVLCAGWKIKRVVEP